MYKKYLKLKEERGITDCRVSVDTGIPASTFSDWKKGRSSPKIAKLKILADYFGVNIEYFLSDELDNNQIKNMSKQEESDNQEGKEMIRANKTYADLEKVKISSEDLTNKISYANSIAIGLLQEIELMNELHELLGIRIDSANSRISELSKLLDNSEMKADHISHYIKNN